MSTPDVIAKELSAVLPPPLVARLMDLIDRKDSCVIDWDKVIPIQKTELSQYAALPEANPATVTQLLKKVAVVCILHSSTL
jgi:hypothetical protein